MADTCHQCGRRNGFGNPTPGTCGPCALGFGKIDHAALDGRGMDPQDESMDKERNIALDEGCEMTIRRFDNKAISAINIGDTIDADGSRHVVADISDHRAGVRVTCDDTRVVWLRHRTPVTRIVTDDNADGRTVVVDVTAAMMDEGCEMNYIDRVKAAFPVGCRVYHTRYHAGSWLVCGYEYDSKGQYRVLIDNGDTRYLPEDLAVVPDLGGAR